MKKYCISCESDQTFKEETIKIPVGKEFFKTEAMVCQKCEEYLQTPAIRKEMDVWGKGIAKNIVEYQPGFNDAVHSYLEETSAKYSIPKTAVVKIWVAFYLKTIVNDPEFETFKEIIISQETQKYAADGAKRKFVVGFNYLGFKAINLYCDVWNVQPSKAVEEAVHFCIGILELGKKVSRLKEIAEELKAFVEQSALVA